jgi:F420-0:gamma-glutamyl ligase
MRTVGTQARGLRAPIVKQGDDLVSIVADCLMQASQAEGFAIRERDVLCVTESLVARAQGNYVTLDEVANQLRESFGVEEIGVVFPILSRNRFSMVLTAIARAFNRVHLLLSYPSDEVGNPLMDQDRMDAAGINPYTDLLTEADYRRIFGVEFKHPFTGLDYVKVYKDMAENDNITVYFANDPRAILRFTRNVLAADIHTRARTKRLLTQAGAEKVLGLDQICVRPSPTGGYNPDYGLLGSNKAAGDMVKLFPRDGQAFVDAVQTRVAELSGKRIEVMIYGDGAFKDPIGKIWELADPVVAPAFTVGLSGTPNEVKIKYLADCLLAEEPAVAVDEAMKRIIREKKQNLTADMAAQGTTPRRITDLLGSLADLTSGSGDKGTPIVLIQGYFDNFAD